MVFLAAFIFLKGNLSKTDNGIESPSPTDVASSDEIKLIDITQEDISKIVLKKKMEKLFLQRKRDMWKPSRLMMTEPQKGDREKEGMGQPIF